MRKHSLLGMLAISCGIALVPAVTIAQEKFSRTQLQRIVKTDMATCDAINGGAPTKLVEDAPIRKEAIVPLSNRTAIPLERVRKTMHGIWRGEVKGDHGDVHVDYFWIIDTQSNEALIIAQRSGRTTLPAQLSKTQTNPVKLSYLMCAHDGYSPGSNTPQIHEFTKVSDTTDGSMAIVQRATGVKFAKGERTLSGMWRKLIATGYFDKLKYVAYAGGFFKPLKIESIETGNGPPMISLNWESEYRGGGTTKLRYTTGVPMRGSERTQFIGVETGGAGQFMLSSPGNGKLWKVEVVDGGNYDLSFDQVSMGPMQ
ncbi:MULTISPECIES: hypothetical protein [unclassified Novosphingobium]|uniref:hypothetical protein n=1 Tax=unclassified Novosphingobium TaxID=2644732 RepID=UPI0025E51018|nr:MULTISPECIES: hypothetical protein [unclassified Novosphingobium]HQV04679.1 hypothetical protein [Novosphingobium sp.]